MRISQNGTVSDDAMILSVRPDGSGNLVEAPGGVVPSPITDLDLSDAITVPVAGQTPGGFNIGGRTQYTGEIQWFDALYENEVESQFGFNQIYKARVHLTRANAGLTFTGAGPFTYYIGPSPMTVSVVSVSASEITLDIVFPRTSVGLATITATYLDGYIYPPVAGGPMTELITTSQYTGTVTWFTVDDPSWNPSLPIFVEGKKYRANVALTATMINAVDGWTFTGLSQDAFSHNSANAPFTATIAGQTATMSIIFVCAETGPAPSFTDLSDFLVPPMGSYTPVRDYYYYTTHYVSLNRWYDEQGNELPMVGDQYAPFVVDQTYICVFEIYAPPGTTFAGLRVEDSTIYYSSHGDINYESNMEITVDIGYNPLYGSVMRGSVVFPSFYVGIIHW
jgi:hypothetical protein